MIQKLSNFFYRLASGQNVLIFLVLEITISTLILPRMSSQIDIHHQGILDIKMRPFTPDEAYNVIGSYGEEGRKLYLLTESVIDIVYPICYGLFFVLFVSFLFKKVFSEGSFWRKLNILPIIAPITDICENLGFISITRAYPNHADGWAEWSNIFSLIKWGMMPISLALMLIGLIGWGLKAMRK